MKLEAYIFFTDQCAQAMRFYEKALGGKLEVLMSGAESPMADQMERQQRADPCVRRSRP